MNKTTLQLSLVLTSLLTSTTVYADSERLFLDVTGHYYIRIDDTTLTANETQLYCEALGGHLATITSQAEQNFIDQIVLKGINGNYFIGASDAVAQNKWLWVTGEKWGYKNWSTGGANGPQPNNGPDEDYLMMGRNNVPTANAMWFDVNSATQEAGYICEWSANKTIATAIIPDINGNHINELAVLYVDYKTNQHTVQIKDMATKKRLNTLTFATSANPPQGIVALKDINGNGISEVGVLFQWKNQPAVFIRDAKAVAGSPLLKILPFLSTAFRPQAITVSPGTYEITVLGQETNTMVSVAETRNSKTGVIIGKSSHDDSELIFFKTPQE